MYVYLTNLIVCLQCWEMQDFINNISIVLPISKKEERNLLTVTVKLFYLISGGYIIEYVAVTDNSQFIFLCKSFTASVKSLQPFH